MVGVLLVGCGGSDATSNPTNTGPTPVDVFTPGNIFSPFSATIAVGGTVNFNISGSPDGHDVTFQAVPGAPASILKTISATVSRTFNTRGTFPYDCKIHPGMSGQIVVQ
jgi:plastocyanin